MRRTKKINKDEIAEDWCFICKDGGLLMVCDYKDCLKAYHPWCVEKDDSFLESDVPWICKWHFCFICKKTPKFHCFCCANAVCGRCVGVAEFAVITRKRGLCNHCLTLAGLVEGIKNPDFDEGKIDFNDRGTYEFMFKVYWEMIKSKEGLTSNHVHKLLNKGIDTEYLDINDISEGEESISEFEGENELISDNDDLNKRKKRKGTQKRKSKKRKQSVINKNVKSKKREFSGWGSKLLFDFLASIGKDTEQELSQYDVAAIITRYCNEHKLFHPEKKKKVICDEWLKSLLGRKSVNKNSIHNLLTPHFAENFEQSEDDFGYSSEGKGGNVSMACKRQRNSSPDRKSQNKEAIPDVQRSCFASVIPENINLIYLRRSLVEELSKQPETFDDRVLGSFVRIKCDPYDYSQKNSHQLLKVKGIKRSSRSGEVNTDILLQVFNMPKDIPICKLSDDNFSKEECEDLQQRVSEGRLERPTVVEFKEKAKSLHDVITKHWILKEITLLQNLIDHANEKGWRRELSEYMDRLLLLRTPTEQSRLLHDIPEIIADEAEVETAENDLSTKDEKGNNTSPESACGGMSKPWRKSSSGNRIPSYLNDGANFAEQKQQSEEPKSEEMVKQHHTNHARGGDDFHQTESCESPLEVKQNCSKASHPELISGQLLASIPQGQPIASGSGQKQQSEEPESEEMARQHHTSHASGGEGIHQTESCESALEVKQNHSKASHSKLISGQLLASIPQGQPIASGSGQKQQSEEPESKEMATQHHTSHARGGDGIHQTENCESALEVKQSHSKASHPELVSGQLLASIPQGQPIASGSGLKQQSEEPESEQMVKQHHTSHASGGDDIHQTKNSESALEVKQNHSKGSHPELISGQLLASIPQGQPIASGSGLKQQSEEPESEEMVKQHHTSHASGSDDIRQTESCESALEVKENYSKASHPELISGQLLASIPQGQPIASGSGQQYQPSTSGEKQEKPVDVEHEKVKNMQSEPQMELIELRNDEEQDTNIAKSKQTPDDLDSSIWYVVSPHGIKRGPYSMSVLKQWSDTSYSELKFKVWKTDQSPEEAVFLTDAICQVFSAKKRKF